MNNQYRIPNIGTFLTAERNEALWDLVAVLIKYVAPIILIGVAIYIVGKLVIMAIQAFRKGVDDDDRDKDDDEYDMRYY